MRDPIVCAEQEQALLFPPLFEGVPKTRLGLFIFEFSLLYYLPFFLVYDLTEAQHGMVVVVLGGSVCLALIFNHYTNQLCKPQKQQNVIRDMIIAGCVIVMIGLWIETGSWFVTWSLRQFQFL